MVSLVGGERGAKKKRKKNKQTEVGILFAIAASWWHLVTCHWWPLLLTMTCRLVPIIYNKSLSCGLSRVLDTRQTTTTSKKKKKKTKDKKKKKKNDKLTKLFFTKEFSEVENINESIKKKGKKYREGEKSTQNKPQMKPFVVLNGFSEAVTTKNEVVFHFRSLWTFPHYSKQSISEGERELERKPQLEKLRKIFSN